MLPVVPNEWWSRGVRFTCLPNCGRCCSEPGGIIYLSPFDVTRLSANFDMEIIDWLNRDCEKALDGRYILKSRKNDQICIYLNSNLECDVYEVKPTQCSAFPWWNENLKTQRSWEKTKVMCPGIEHSDAIMIEGNEIMMWKEADHDASIGFRRWPPSKRKSGKLN